MLTPKIFFTETIHANPWYKYSHDQYQIDNGPIGDYYYCQSSESSLVVPILHDGRLLLLRQYRYLQQMYGIEFPRGRSLDEESPTDTARRELLEETGYCAIELVKIGEFSAANNIVKSSTSLFVCSDLKISQEPAPKAGEVIEVIIRRLDEFEEMIKNGEIWDGHTLAAWAIARDYIKGLL